MVDVSTLKGLLAGGLFCITYICSISPIGLRIAAKKKHYSMENPHASPSGYRFMLAFSFLSCYGGGIFLSTCLLDLFPDCQETLRKGAGQMGWNIEFPLAEFFVTFGFTLILFSEQIGLWWKETSPDPESFILGHGHSHQEPHQIPAQIEEKNDENHTHSNSATPSRQASERDRRPFGPLTPMRRRTVNPIDDEDVISEYDVEVFPKVTVVPINGSPVANSGEELTEVEISGESEPSSTLSDDKILRRTSTRIRRASTIKAHFDPNTHSTLRAILLVTALSLHACFEGMALGLQNDREKIWTLFIALCIHKSLVAFSLGIRLVQSQLKNRSVAFCCAIFCGMAIIGAIFGILLMEHVSSALGNVVSGVLRGVACGTFIYVTFFEILPHELNPSGYRLVKLLTLALGVATVCIIFLIFPDA